jgi:hypothetical protein
MPEHEPTDAAREDSLSGRKHEARAARAEGTEPEGLDSPDAGTAHRPVPSDDAQVASEPMTLQQLPDSARKPSPPGRQKTGDPPAV